MTGGEARWDERAVHARRGPSATACRRVKKWHPLDSGRGFVVLLSFSSPARPRWVADILARLLRRSQARTPRLEPPSSQSSLVAPREHCHAIRSSATATTSFKSDRGINGLYGRRQVIQTANFSLLHRFPTSYYGVGILRIRLHWSPDGCFDGVHGGAGTNAGVTAH